MPSIEELQEKREALKERLGKQRAEINRKIAKQAARQKKRQDKEDRAIGEFVTSYFNLTNLKNFQEFIEMKKDETVGDPRSRQFRASDQKFKELHEIIRSRIERLEDQRTKETENRNPRRRENS